ncbi:hypothetical protein C7293_07985 [filamentous cyanobacterium CCT1]|nr:hypothetical protein C7293_07985 [filamentous cyanobacterium CCT1]PSN80693.1 hypothetical protein C8B47_05205 [filamentous cyanobacterium CCP4]
MRRNYLVATASVPPGLLACALMLSLMATPSTSFTASARGVDDALKKDDGRAANLASSGTAGGDLAGEAELISAVPAAGVLTRLFHTGGTIFLGTSPASQWQEMAGGAASRLMVPARSGANIEFRPAGASGIIPGYLVEAGSPLVRTEYWYPCSGLYGRFVMGWSAGSGTPTCSEVRMGRNTFPNRTGRSDSKALKRTAAHSPEPWTTDHAQRLKGNFSDTLGHWAEADIDALNSQGVIAGFPDGTFRPNASVTRAEFAAMVSRAFSDRTASGVGQTFSDVANHWGKTAIANANLLGFIAGYPDGTFGPERNVSRLEAIVALASGLALEGSTDLTTVYSDAGQIPAWAINQVSAAAQAGIRVQGPNATQLNPQQPASRADIATLIARALEDGGGAETDMLITPTTPATTWAWVDVSDQRLEVKVLGGEVLVGPERAPQRVAAPSLYVLEWNNAGITSEQVKPLSSDEQRAIANAAEVVSFLEDNSWSPATAPQLPPYRLYRDALLKSAEPPPAEPPDLSASAIEFNLGQRTSQFAGRVQIVGTVTNLGGDFSSAPGQQQIQLYEVFSGARSQLVASQSFQNLAAGNTLRVVYERDWNASSPAEGEFPPGYRLVIAYDPDILQDGNPSNDDSNRQNNQLDRSGSDINGLFSQTPQDLTPGQILDNIFEGLEQLQQNQAPNRGSRPQ